MKVVLVYTRNLAYAGRVQKILGTLKEATSEIEVFDGAQMKNEELAERLGVKYNSYPIINHRLGTLNQINTILFCYRVGKKISHSKAEYVLCHDLHTLLAGVFSKRSYSSIKVIYDCSELSVERYRGVKKIIWSIILKISIPYCHKIIHANEYRMQYFTEKHKIDTIPNIVIKNYPLKSFMIDPIPEKRISNIINVIYLGTIIPHREHIKVIEAFNRLPKNYRLDIVGQGKKEIIDQFERLIADNNQIRILPPVPNDEIEALLKSYHIGLIFYEPINLNNYYCAPNKIYEYLFNGLCVISYDFPSIKSIIENNNVGACITTINETTIRNAIDNIVADNCFKNINIKQLREYVWEDQFKTKNITII